MLVAKLFVFKHWGQNECRHSSIRGSSNNSEQMPQIAAKGNEEAILGSIQLSPV